MVKGILRVMWGELRTGKGLMMAQGPYLELLEMQLLMGKE